MPRYFFDIYDGDGFHPDGVGDECDSFADARAQAQTLLPHIARDELPNGDLHTIACEVRDASGAVVYRGELTYRGTHFPE